MKNLISHTDLRFESLSPGNWPLFETLMGEKGGCGGCWCMLFRLSAREFKEDKYEGHKRRMEAIVRSGKPVGLLAIYREEAVGWVAFSPREDLDKIEGSRSLKRIDEKPVWSVSCFFVKKEYRGRGLSKQLIRGVIQYARAQHIPIIEAYPAIPYSDKMPPPFLWIGVLSAFTGQGFTIVRQNGRSRAMVRLEL